MDWLNNKDIEYIVDEDIFYIFNVKEKCTKKNLNLENNDDHNK